MFVSQRHQTTVWYWSFSVRGPSELVGLKGNLQKTIAVKQLELALQCYAY